MEKLETRDGLGSGSGVIAEKTTNGKRVRVIEGYEKCLLVKSCDARPSN